MAELLTLINSIDSIFLVIYGIHIGLLILLGILNKVEILQIIRKPTAIYSFAWMTIIAFLATVIFISKWYIPLMIAGITGSLFAGRHLITNKTNKQFLLYILPITIFGIYFTAAEAIPLLHTKGLPLTIALASILTILTGIFYEKIEMELGKIGYYVGQIMYAFGLLLLLDYFFKNKWITTCILLLSILVFYHLYRRLEYIVIAWIIGVVSCLSYFALIGSIWNGNGHLFEVFMKFGWIGLFLFTIILRNTDFRVPFLAISHIYLLGALAIDQLQLGNVGYLPFIYAFLVYTNSIFLVQHQYFRQAFRYAAYLSSFLF